MAQMYSAHPHAVRDQTATEAPTRRLIAITSREVLPRPQRRSEAIIGPTSPLGLQALKNDNRATFQASAHAQRATDYLHRLQPSPRRRGIALTEANLPALRTGVCRAAYNDWPRVSDLGTESPVAGPDHDVEIHDMHHLDVANRAKQYGVRSLPAVVVDGKFAGCCAGRGPDEHVLRDALR